MKLVVTGASGFIGHNVLLRAPRDWNIFAVYHSTPGLDAFVKEHGLTQRAARCKCDLLSAADVSALARTIGAQAGRDVVSRGERRSGCVGRAAALGSRIEHGRVREHCSSTVPPITWSTCRRARSTTDCTAR